jgi:hypothetical protein
MAPELLFPLNLPSRNKFGGRRVPKLKALIQERLAHTCPKFDFYAQLCIYSARRKSVVVWKNRAGRSAAPKALSLLRACCSRDIFSTSELAHRLWLSLDKSAGMN